MIYEPKEFISKANKHYLLRSPNKEDSAKMLEYLKTVSEETPFLINYPEEITFTVEKEEEFLESFLNDKRGIMIAVFKDDEAIGNVSFSCVRNSIKLRHRCTMGIAIKKKACGEGIGNMLMQEIIKKAIEAGYEQMELAVYSANRKAIGLYRKHGFKECALLPHAGKLKDGSYLDEIRMVKDLKSTL